MLRRWQPNRQAQQAQNSLPPFHACTDNSHPAPFNSYLRQGGQNLFKESCLDRMIFIGQSSLQRRASQFVLHYHAERNHQGLGNKIIRPDLDPLADEGAIRCRKRLGRLLRYYYREAA
jgi:hypothetical protein